jgi:hypothetical protein
MARLDRDPPEPDSVYANTAEVAKEDRVILPTATGRERSAQEEPAKEGEESVFDQEVREKGEGNRPVGDKTNFHLSGTGAIETDDGLDETSEMARHAAEDIPDEGITDEPEDRPVFDRGSDI